MMALSLVVYALKVCLFLHCLRWIRPVASVVEIVDGQADTYRYITHDPIGMEIPFYNVSGMLFKPTLVPNADCQFDTSQTVLPESANRTVLRGVDASIVIVDSYEAKAHGCWTLAQISQSLLEYNRWLVANDLPPVRLILYLLTSSAPNVYNFSGSMMYSSPHLSAPSGDPEIPVGVLFRRYCDSFLERFHRTPPPVIANAVQVPLPSSASASAPLPASSSASFSGSEVAATCSAAPSLPSERRLASACSLSANAGARVSEKDSVVILASVVIPLFAPIFAEFTMGASQSRPAGASNSAADASTNTMADYMERARTSAQTKLDQILYETTTAATAQSASAQDGTAPSASKEQSWSEFFGGFGTPNREGQAEVLAQAQASIQQQRRIKERAIDNCADVHADLRECFRNGSWRDWLTMCELRRNAFWNCVSRQEAILRELNYAGRDDSTPEADWEIAMEADRIGREQQAAEERAAAAKE
ncbi:hypothetical protein SYNPS1DRAFT_31226 [Syncephalis pseudoplumigaleata]|uniref:Uncharacterized protein n=1 Tax=Syncephalis pseudoplumigaleata TaxID=1712513 RepID=A0A4V1J0X5_9FUNG|nr:hypothetical protein SYNPS1DRAFT_31226 [Syncephalis pseudoplumigaleata]|eukprot:RKP23079.1 hypothetical protein SYNPS1DRAFT_31226 [Syncephalis pseudoplumigaleata]